MIVTKSKSSGEVTVDLAAKVALLKEDKEVETVVAIGKPCQDLALTHAILDGEAGRGFGPPADIAELVDIHEDDKAEKDETEVLDHLPE